MTRLRMWMIWIAIAVGAWLALCAFVWAVQDRLIYFPGPPPSRTPRDFGLAHEEVELVAADGVKLHAWWIPAADARGAALVCHGNAGSIEHRIGLAAELVRDGVSALLFDYRGYGKSEGKPNERGLQLDAAAGYAWIAARGFDAARVVLWGESLGGAVAAELATQHACAGLVLESAFTSLADIGSSAYPFLPVRLLARSRYDTRACIARLDVPVLVVHGSGDEIVPFDHARSLVAAARRTPELIEFAGGHNDKGWLEHPPSRARVKAFLDAALRAAK
jgi:fermentation-respiration switch protein FrsA (DUF1100 family)